ncbi:MAG: ROK family protein [Victivallaceae bacterium]|nr:ROK family protein [Victivallaceae bacterium]
MKDIFTVLGYDIGGTKLGIGLVRSDGRLLGQARIENKDTRPEEILPQMAESGRRLIAAAGLDANGIRAVGISAPCPADIPNGVLTAPTNNPHWRNVPVKQYLAAQFGVEAYFDNDANAGVLAEWFFGAGRGAQNLVYLTMSSGIGGGIIANGRLVQGASYHAGEIGHMVLTPDGPVCSCGLRGCYEAYCGGIAVARRVQRELAGQIEHPIVKFAGGKLADIDLIAIEKAVRAGNSYAAALWDEFCRRNAQAYGMLMNILNPEKIILGTIAWAAGELFMEPVLKYVPHFAWRETYEACEIVPSQLRREIGCYAGAAVAFNQLHEGGEFGF